MEKNIKLTLDQAIKMYGKNPEMDELLLANFTMEELTKPILPKKWEDLTSISGCWISGSSQVVKLPSCSIKVENKNIYATEKQAKSALAMAQLSQLMAVYNDGWEPDWSSESVLKYVIYRKNNVITTDSFYQNYCFLTFKSREIRDEFLKNFDQLIKEYFML